MWCTARRLWYVTNDLGSMCKIPRPRRQRSAAWARLLSNDGSSSVMAVCMTVHSLMYVDELQSGDSGSSDDCARYTLVEGFHGPG